jgi:predicted ATPase/DNA-binding CsgD family transcriptional regulator
MHEMDSLPEYSLPTPLTTLVGREREITAVGALLSRPEIRLVTLTGTGGVGKTRLALEVAAAVSNFADGICFVALALLTDPALVASTIAHALGVREQASQPRLQSLKDHLRDKQVLLLLDNFEQVVSAAPVVAELLVAAPRLHVLVNSRTSLHLSGEHEFVVPPLSLPDLADPPPLERLGEYEAIRLFIERAQAVQADFVITEGNATAIAAICHQLDGLPLAIELAAGRSKLLSPQALLPRLQSRLKLLVGGAQNLPLRQQTLRGTIAWSYDLLVEDEKRLSRRLAVFVGGCTLEAVEAACTAHGDLEEDLLDVVGRLVDKSLLRQEAEIDGEPRLLMLETIREYGLERLAASGEEETVRQRHATFFLALAEEVEPKLQSSEQANWYSRLETEHDNLRAALHWTLERKEAEMGLRLGGALYRFWRYRNHVREGRSWLEQVLAQPGTQAHSIARAKALRGAGLLAFSQGDFSEAHRLVEESVSIGREAGAAGKRELSSALATLAHVSLFQGNPGDTRELAGESLQLLREMGEPWGIARALCYQGLAMIELGEPLAAQSLLEESVALFRAVGDRQLLAQSLNALGLAALRRGDYARADSRFEEALAVARETGAEQYLTEALTHLGTLALRLSDSQQSAAFYQQSLALNRALGNRNGLAENLAGLAEVASRLGQPERAARLFGAVEALREVSNIRLSPLRRAAYDRTVRGIRAQLDEAAFEASWSLGRTIPLEQVITYAQDTQGEPLDAQGPVKILSLSSKASSPAPAGLTTREVEVLRFLARGLSNAQIAEELVVSQLTVKAHLRSIYSKLGVTSRSAATRFALEHHLN